MATRSESLNAIETPSKIMLDASYEKDTFDKEIVDMIKTLEYCKATARANTTTHGLFYKELQYYIRIGFYPFDLWRF